MFAEHRRSARRDADLLVHDRGAAIPDDPDAIRELIVEHWTRPVEFRRTIETLYDEGARVFVEAGPRGNLTGVRRGHPPRPRRTAPCPPTFRGGRASRSSTTSSAMLAAHDVELDARLPVRAPRRGALESDAPSAAPPARGRRATCSLAMSLADAAPAGERARADSRAVPAPPNGAGPAPSASGARAGGRARQCPRRRRRRGAARPCTAPAAPSDELALVMDAHAATMDRFLDRPRARSWSCFLAESALDAEVDAPRPAPCSRPGGRVRCSASRRPRARAAARRPARLRPGRRRLPPRPRPRPRGLRHRSRPAGADGDAAGDEPRDPGRGRRGLVPGPAS